MGFNLADHPIDKTPIFPSGYIYSLIGAISQNRGVTVMILRAHLEDNGYQDGQGVFAVAGYMGLPKDWDVFHRDWTRVLKTFNKRHRLSIRYFHPTDLVYGREDFKNVAVSERVELLSKLLILGRRRAGLGVGGFVLGRDYREMLGRLEQPAASLPAPFALCAEAAIVMAKSSSPEDARIRPTALIIEKGHRYADELRDGFKRAQQSTEMSELMAMDSFSEAPKEIAGLQLADFYAWTLAAKQNRENYKIPAVFEQVISGFLYTHRHGYCQYDLSRLRAGRNPLLSLRQARLGSIFLERNNQPRLGA